MTNRDYLKNASSKALDGLIDLWCSMEDTEHGGFGTIDAFGRKDFTSNRSVVMQGRTLYGLSAAYRATGNHQCAALARRQFEHIRNHWIDPEYGGVWTEMTCTGVPLAKEKAVYENAFALYGLTEYVRAFDDSQALEFAKEIYFALERTRKKADADAGYDDCYCQTWERTVSRTCGRQRAASGEYGLDNQSHIIEAYSNLYRVWRDDSLRKRLMELADLFCSKLYCPGRRNVCGRYDRNWNPRTKDESFGDDFEVAWLIDEIAQLTADENLQKKGRFTALSMIDRALEQALDPEYGGIYDSIRNGNLETRKMWWCNCEAINACLNAYAASGYDTYLDYAAKLWDFYERYLIAPEGYWRGVVQRNGTPLQPEGPRAMPICAYHSVRVCVKTLEVVDGGT